MAVGALLVIAGILASALADRIRGSRIERRTAKPIGQLADIKHAPRHHIEEQVIDTLVASGWRKPLAKAAACQCSNAERATLDSWIRAALKNAGKMTVTS